MSQAAADQLTAEGHALFDEQRYADAAARFERATAIFPTHAQAWKGLGHALLCLGRAPEASRAFDRAIGLRPDSATALWGGALAHAELGQKLVARDYLRRALALQPTWLAMAQEVPKLAAFLQTSARTADLVRSLLGAYSVRTYRHAGGSTASAVRSTIEIARIPDCPDRGTVTYVSIGLSDVEWPEPGRPRAELILASTVDGAICGQLLAQAVFHLTAKQFFPEPGKIVRDVIGVLGGDLAARLPHLYFTVPRPWPVPLPLDPGPPPITLVMAVPVSDREYQHWRAHGHAAFEAALTGAGIDLADLRRASVL